MTETTVLMAGKERKLKLNSSAVMQLEIGLNAGILVIAQRLDAKTFSLRDLAMIITIGLIETGEIKRTELSFQASLARINGVELPPKIDDGVLQAITADGIGPYLSAALDLLTVAIAGANAVQDEGPDAAPDMPDATEDAPA